MIMTSTTEVNKSPRLHLFETLKSEILGGTYTIGQKLPTEMNLAQKFQVSRGTVRNALNLLIQSGLVEQRHGFGCYVAEEVKSEQEKFTKTICFLVPINTNRSFYTKILSGAEAELNNKNYKISFVNLADFANNPNRLVGILQESNYAGIIFAPLTVTNYYEVNSKFIDIFETLDIPYVVVDSPVAKDGMIVGNFVGTDGYRAMREIVHNLVELGHRKIASIRVFSGVYTADQRAHGIFDQLICENIKIENSMHLIVNDVEIENQGRVPVRSLMASITAPTAIICSHDIIAMNVIDELKKMNYQVPEDVSVVGFDDDYFSSLLDITTVRQPFKEVGKCAVNLLLPLCESKSKIRQQIFLPCEIIQRNSAQKCKH